MSRPDIQLDNSKQYQIHNIEEDLNEVIETTEGNGRNLSPVNLNAYLRQKTQNNGSNQGSGLTSINEREENKSDQSAIARKR